MLNLFDLVVGAVSTNDLLKAGPIAACLIAAWVAGHTLEESSRLRRRILLVILAAACAVATTKITSRWVAYPRPFVLTQNAYRLSGDQLVSYPKAELRMPDAPDSQERAANLAKGIVSSNDWESFPSDHAGFFGCLALGLFWVHRRIGTFAVSWMLFVILGGKWLRGLHRPADLIAGLAIALIFLLLWRQLDRFAWLDRVGQWTVRQNAWATAALFLVAVEVTSTLDHLQDAALSARTVVRAFLQ